MGTKLFSSGVSDRRINTGVLPLCTLTANKWWQFGTSVILQCSIVSHYMWQLGAVTHLLVSCSISILPQAVCWFSVSASFLYCENLVHTGTDAVDYHLAQMWAQTKAQKWALESCGFKLRQSPWQSEEVLMSHSECNLKKDTTALQLVEPESRCPWAPGFPITLEKCEKNCGTWFLLLPHNMGQQMESLKSPGW